MSAEKYLVLPEWTKGMPDDACLDSKELAAILGCTTKYVYAKLGGCGLSLPALRASGHRKIVRWTMLKLRMIEQEHKKLKGEKQCTQ